MPPFALPFSLPFSPRRLVIGANAHAELKAFIGERRPDIEIRGAKFTDLSAADLAWGEAYIGFKRPPSAADAASHSTNSANSGATATMGAVRWVHCTGAGVDSWLAPIELDRAVLLTRTTESFGPMIAEWAVSRVLAFQQQLFDVARAQSERRWAHREVKPVAGTRALVVGTGDVGTAVGRQLAALGCVVTGVSRTGAAHSGVALSGVARSGVGHSGIAPAGGSANGTATPFSALQPVGKLAELVGDADWIVLTLPITPATHSLVNRAILSRCRGAVLLNAGRGQVLDESALPEALDQGWLRGAALDVFEVEPLPDSSPLWTDPRIMVSPHMSGPTTIAGAGNGFLECLAELEQGRIPRWVVDRDRGY